MIEKKDRLKDGSSGLPGDASGIHGFATGIYGFVKGEKKMITLTPQIKEALEFFTPEVKEYILKEASDWIETKKEEMELEVVKETIKTLNKKIVGILNNPKKW